MGRRGKTHQLTDSILGQHLALSVAAHLARSQLVPDPLKVYDGQHMSEMLDVVANALARVAPMYVQDPLAGAPRQLMEAELDGAKAKRGAGVLVLKEGRILSGVSIKRADLRQAIAILKAVGIPELARAAPEPAKTELPPADRLTEMRNALDEVEHLVKLPMVAAQAERANAKLLSIARHSPEGIISNLAMRLMSAVHEARDSPDPDGRQIALMLARLRDALGELHPPSSLTPRD
jgi:hypothetical protein